MKLQKNRGGKDFQRQWHLSPCSVVETGIPTSFMTKIEYPFLKTAICWKPSVSLGYRGREERRVGDSWKSVKKTTKQWAAAFFHLKVSIGCDHWLWPFMRSRELITSNKDRHVAIIPGEEGTFSMQGVTWEQMIQKELTLPKSWRSTGFEFLFSIWIASHSFPLNYNTNLSCFNLNLLPFIPPMPPVLPNTHSYCLVNFNCLHVSLTMDMQYGLAPSFSYGCPLVSVRINFLGWVVCTCNETVSKHTKHLLLFSHSQSILSCPRRTLQQSDTICSWNIFFLHYLLILTYALLIYSRISKDKSLLHQSQDSGSPFSSFLRITTPRLFQTFTSLPIIHSFSAHHSLSWNSFSLFSG